MRVKNPLNRIETIASIVVIVFCIVGANVSKKSLDSDQLNLYWQENFMYLQDEELGEDASDGNANRKVYWSIDDVFKNL